VSLSFKDFECSDSKIYRLDHIGHLGMPYVLISIGKVYKRNVVYLMAFFSEGNEKVQDHVFSVDTTETPYPPLDFLVSDSLRIMFYKLYNHEKESATKHNLPFNYSSGFSTFEPIEVEKTTFAFWTIKNHSPETYDWISRSNWLKGFEKEISICDKYSPIMLELAKDQ
jgi:hypothetical protein